jgi:protein phosphatase 1 regulatory subunit 7
MPGTGTDTGTGGGTETAGATAATEWVPPKKRLVCPVDVTSVAPGTTSVYYVGTSGQKVTALSGLQHLAEALEELCLRSNLIRSLAGIEALSRLVTLELADNQIRTLGPMDLGATCPRLTNLDMSYNQIRRIENIRGLTCLTRLYVANNKLTTIGMEEGLGSLPASLKRLDLGANRIRRMENLPPSLEQLWLGKNKITEIMGLGEMDGSLRILDVQSNRLVALVAEASSDVGVGAGGEEASAANSCAPGGEAVGLELECLAGLEELYLSHNGIGRVQGLTLLTALNTLDLSNNKISILEGMAQLQALEECWMNDNGVSDFDCVAAQLKPLPKLKTVYLERNPVSKEFGYRKQLAAMLPTLTQIDASRIPGRRR